MSASSTPADLTSAVQPHLRAGEKVRWVGRPPQGAWGWRRDNRHLRAAVVSAALLALSPTLALLDPGLGENAITWTCGGVGLIALLAVLKRDAQWRARTVYALTDVRALVCRADGRGTAESLPIPNKARIEHERRGRATIYIGEVPRQVLTIGFKRYYLDHHKQIAFQAVEDGRTAYALIRGRGPSQPG